MSPGEDLTSLPMKERMKCLLSTATLHDCCFIFVNDGYQQQYAHKLILSTASPVFAAMFFGQMANDEPIEIDDIQPHIFKRMLDFIYTDTCSFESEIGCDLYYAGEKYMLPSLKKLCLAEITRTLRADNACRIYEFADLFKIDYLVYKAKMYIYHSCLHVLRSESIGKVQLKTLHMILDLENLPYTDYNYLSENTFFDAVLRWGQEECARRGLSTDDETLRPVVDSAIKKIRFLRFSAEEFAGLCGKSKILTSDENHRILLNILNTATSFSMPEGFSKDVQNRYANTKYRLVSPFGSEPNIKEEESVDCLPEIEVRIKDLLKTQKFTDCSFLIIDDRLASPVKFNAHKLILSAGSTVFYQMLAVRTANDKPVEIRTIKPEHFKLLLDFMYTKDCILPESPEEIYEFSLNVFEYGLLALLEECFDKWITFLNHANVFQIFENAENFNLPPRHRIYYHCLNLIIKDLNVFIQDCSFEDIKLTTLLAILHWQGVLRVSTAELFQATMRWAHKECKRKALPINNGNLRKVVDPALKKIHFLKYPAKEFAEGPAESNILSIDESEQLLINILDSKTCIPMPEGFSTERVQQGIYFDRHFDRYR